MQFPSTSSRADHVVPSLNDDRRKVLNDIDVVENVSFFNEDGVDEVMANATAKSRSSAFSRYSGSGKRRLVAISHRVHSLAAARRTSMSSLVNRR